MSTTIETCATTTPSEAPLDTRSFRDVMGAYPTGVVLITAMTPQGPAGLAANSFTSVSLTPPLVAFCPMLTSSSWSLIRSAGSFAVNILAAHQEELSRLFSAKGADRFVRHQWTTSPQGHPVLSDALGWLDVSTQSITVAGDHEVVIARAEAWSEPAGGDPLVFHRGGYRALAS